MARTLASPPGAAAEERRAFGMEVMLNGRTSTIPLDAGSAHFCEEMQDASRITGFERGVDARVEVVTVAAARILMAGCSDPMRAYRRIAAAAADLLQLGMDAVAYQSVPVGCIPGMQLRARGAGDVEALLYAPDASHVGHGVLVDVVRGMARPLERLSDCSVPPGIQLSEARVTRVCASCRVSLAALQPGRSQRQGAGEAVLATLTGHELAAVERFSADAHDPELASRHNARVFEALCHVASRWRIEPWRLVACAERHALRWGSCEPLVRWCRHAQLLHGEMLLPIDVEAFLAGLPGEATSDQQRRSALAAELALQAGCAGLMASLVFLRGVLATTGR